MRIEKLRPLRDQVVCELVFEKLSAGGIIIPENASENEKPVRGVVVATGPGCWEHGKFIEVSAKVGERVLLRRFAGMEFESNGKQMITVDDKHVLGVIDEARS